MKNKCLKWTHITHLDIWNTLQPKERSGVKLIVWFLTIKSQESTRFFACKWHATYHWKVFDKGYNFVLDLILIEGLHTKLWGPKVVGIPTLGLTPIWESWDKMSFGCEPCGEHIVYYKGEGGGFPQVRAVVSLVSPSLPIARPNTKSGSTMH